jgi:hypothetical protein
VPAFGATDHELTIGRNTLGIPDCAAELTGVTTSHVAPTAHQPEGGSLLMRVMFPPGVKSAWRPVLALGRPGAADTLSVYYMGLDVGQFRLDHWAGPMAVGTSLPIDKTVGHDVEIWLPTFASTAFGHAATGDAWVTVDGREALRVSTSNFGFAPTEFALGVNQTHAMMDDRYFRGAFVQRQWTGTASPTVP